MYRTILVPLDGSPVAERALPFAKTVARATGAPLLLVRAALIEPRRGRPDPEEEAIAVEEAQVYLDTVAAGLGVSPPPETAVYYGEPGQAIMEAMREHRPSLVAMSSHGHSGTGHWTCGTVADRVLRRSDVPVLLVPPCCDVIWPTARAFRVLVALDGSVAAEDALGPASQLALALGAELQLLRVVDPSHLGGLGFVGDPTALLTGVRHYLDGVAEPLRAQGLSVDTRGVLGPVGPSIAKFAAEQRAGLIALTVHGTGSGSRQVLGQVATTILQRAEVPVLIVRPSGGREELERAAQAETTESVSVLLTPHELAVLTESLESRLATGIYGGRPTQEIHELLSRLKHASTLSEVAMI